MKKFITLALVLGVITLAARAQSTAQKDIKPAAAPAPAAEVKNNPLYQPSGDQGVNPLFEGSAKTAGSPIGGIVVKGGQNGLETAASSNPIPGVGVVVKHNVTEEQKTTGNPIGGIVVKSEKGISEKGIK